MCTAILPLSAYGHDCLSLYICHYHSCIRTKCPAMCSLWRARPSPIPEALQLKAMTPHRYHWRRQFQWQILDIFKPLHSMISLPEWSHFWINDSDENQSMSKVYHDQSGIIRCYKLQRIYIVTSINPESFAAFGSSRRGVPKRAIQGQLPGWVASTPLLPRNWQRCFSDGTLVVPKMTRWKRGGK